MTWVFRVTLQCVLPAVLVAVFAGPAHSSEDLGRGSDGAPKGAQSWTFLTLPQATITVGDAITLTAQVDGASPTGFVSFRSGEASIAGCAAVALSGPYPPRAQCTASRLAAGFHTLTALYGGDSNNDPSGSVGYVLFVNQRPIIGAPAQVTMFEDDRLLAVPLALSDPDSGLDLSTLRAVSNDQVLLGNHSLSPYTWQGQQYFRLLPAHGVAGTAQVTVSVADVYGATSSRVVPVTVLSVNDPPVISTLRTRLHPAGSTGPAESFFVTVHTLGAREFGQTATRSLEVVNDPNGVVSSLIGSSGYVLSGNGGTARLRLSVTDDGGRENGGNDTASNEISVVVADGNNLSVNISDWPGIPSPWAAPWNMDVVGSIYNEGPAGVTDVAIAVESTGVFVPLVQWFCSFDGCPSPSQLQVFEFTVPVIPSGGFIQAMVSAHSGPSLNRIRLSARSSDPVLLHSEDDMDEVIWTEPNSFDFLSLSGFEPR